MPRALARSRPSLVRARIKSLSNSASPARTVSMSRPWGVVISAHASPSERKPASFSVIAASVFSKSGWSGRADRAVSPLVRRRRRARRASGEAAPGRFWRRSPLRGIPYPPHASVAPPPERRRSDRRSIPAHSRKSVNHGFILHHNSAPKKPNRFKALILVRIS
jgi:hypothetical protein